MNWFSRPVHVLIQVMHLFNVMRIIIIVLELCKLIILGTSPSVSYKYQQRYARTFHQACHNTNPMWGGLSVLRIVFKVQYSETIFHILSYFHMISKSHLSSYRKYLNMLLMLEKQIHKTKRNSKLSDVLYSHFQLWLFIYIMKYRTWFLERYTLLLNCFHWYQF